MSDDVISLLATLRRPPANLPDYYGRLGKSGDDYLRLGALAALLELGVLPSAEWDRAVAESRFAAVARRAFRFFNDNFEHELSERVVERFENSTVPTVAQELRASLDMDASELALLEGQLFLSDGRIDHLLNASAHAEAASGWREAAVWSARATALQPFVPATALQLLDLLENANQFDTMRQVLAIFRGGNVFTTIRTVYEGALLLHENKPSESLRVLSKLRPQDIPNHSLRARLFRIMAQAHEGLKDYREAYALYQRQNNENPAVTFDKLNFLKNIDRLARVDVPALPSDTRQECFMMVGFPRSGTTLLENALAAHPEVETFEEISSMTSAMGFLQRVLDDNITVAAKRQEVFERARQRYYVEIDRRRKRPGARVLVDKLPIGSAHIQLMEKLFPEKRYIFSIRHPFDVVLSCFKQNFMPNAAMENFRTIEDACNLYDRVMSIWFGVFPGETERVLYIRYDDLVTDFRTEVTRALAFLGVDWNDEINRFAELSDARQVTTPSYAKVRSGLTIGVQSSWQHYRFLFDTPHGRKLHKWIDRFGYSS